MAYITHTNESYQRVVSNTRVANIHVGASLGRDQGEFFGFPICLPWTRMISQYILHGLGVEGRLEGDALSTRKCGLGRVYAANMGLLMLVGSIQL